MRIPKHVLRDAWIAGTAYVRREKQLELGMSASSARQENLACWMDQERRYLNAMRATAKVLVAWMKSRSKTETK